MSTTVEEMFRYYTNRAGELSRNLSLVGVGAIWLIYNKFQIGAEGVPILLDKPLKYALILIFVSLSLDVLQYIIAILQWGNLYKNKQKSHSNANEQTFEINTALIFILFKLMSMVAAYGFILCYMINTQMFQVP